MDVPKALLIAFPPSVDEMLDVAHRPIDDFMLREIAHADYGVDAEVHLKELLLICDHGVVPKEDRWHPIEVLELTRWADPDHAAPPYYSSGLRVHQMRAFACAAILRSAEEWETSGEYAYASEDPTLAILLVSADAIGKKLLEAAARFLTWRFQRATYHAESLKFAIALIVVATLLRKGRFSDSDLAEAAQWVLNCEATGRQTFDPLDPRHHDWQYGHPSFVQELSFWQPLAARFMSETSTVASPELREILELIGAVFLLPKNGPR